jgi:beta-lactamase class A
MAAGYFDLNRVVTLAPSDRDAGWGDLVFAPAGSRYRVQRLLQLMITESDNTATNMLIRLVGRAHINATMLHLGLRQTRLADYIRSDGDIRSLRTSPRDMTVLLDRMAHDELINPWSSRAMIAILTGQRHNGLLPQPLPPGTQIAHKTGTLHDTLNDVGIVYLNDSPYIIAVLTTHLVTLDSGRQFIRGVSRLAYDALAKFASWREANPLPGLAAAALPAQLNESPDVRMWMPRSEAASDATPARTKPFQPVDASAESSADPGSPTVPLTPYPTPSASP